MNFLTKKILNIKKRKLIKFLITQITSDKSMSSPEYMDGIAHESDMYNIGPSPLIIVWGLNISTGEYSISVNPVCLHFYLKTYLPEGSPYFLDVRDELSSLILALFTLSIDESIKKSCTLPNELFRRCGEFSA